MGPIDATWHVLNLFAVPLLTGLIAATLAKLLWRRDLAGVPWWRLAVTSGIACAAVAVGGLVAFGQDGRLATYAAMVAACAVALWWRGAGRRR